MGKSKTPAYSHDNLRHALALHPQNVSLQSLARGFDIKESGLPELSENLKALVDEGFAVSERKDYFRAKNPLSDLVVVTVLGDRQNPEKRPQDVELRIEGVGDDFPFTVTSKGNLIRRKFGRDLMPGESMAVTINRRHGTELHVTKIIDRYKNGKQPSIVGYFNGQAAGDGATHTFKPLTPGIATLFAAAGKIPENPNARIPFLAHIPRTINPYAPVLSITEQKWDPDTGAAISLIIANKHGVTPRHAKDIEDEAQAAYRRPLSIAGRRDLSLEPILVIDPTGARDHDDGIMIERTREGYRTMVVISDVPHYVRPDTTLNAAARRRGLTHYLPDDTFHMLPDKLVKAASLHEGRSKPVIFVEQFWDLDGEKVGRPEIGAGIVAHQKQLTYGQFDDMVRSHPSKISAYIELGDILVEKMRFEKPMFDMGDDNRQSSYSQMLVSSLMIEANSAIAEFLLENNVPFLSRSHTGSDNVYAFLELKEKLGNWGYDVPTDISGMTNEGLRRIIAEAEGRNDKVRVESAIRADFLNQAVYSVLPYSHFGLNRENYTHATSPIRRYPDLLALRGVHTVNGNHELGLSEMDMEHMPETAKSMNMLQGLGKLIVNDSQKYYTVRDLQRLEGHMIRATMGPINDFRAEIILNNQSGLRKTIDLGNLPEGWVRTSRGNSLLYKGKTTISEGDPIRIHITNVRPHMGDWDFSNMEPAPKRLKPLAPPTSVYVPSVGIA